MEPQQEKDKEAIEFAILDIALLGDLPEQSIELCMARYAEAGSYLRRLLEKYAEHEEETRDTSLGIFRGLHIMGAMRDTQAFQPLLKMLRRPEDDLDEVLGDAITETLPRIAVSTFDGDVASLLEAIADQERGEVVRDSLLRAAAFLTWEGRIDRQRMIAFLEQFGSGALAVAGEFVWNAWVDAIALLGLRQLEPLVLQALANGLIDEFIFERDDFYQWLEHAEREPANIERFSAVHIGHLDDVLDVLRKFSVDEDEGDEAPDWRDLDNESNDNAGNQPVINPWRHVGRNDPCPCGSGKKAKRCCLAA